MQTTLTSSPALGPLLARGALLSPFKRPRPDADYPRTRLELPGVRIDLTRLAAYERVCGFPTGDDSLPVTYPHVLGFPLAMRLMSGRDFPLPLLGLVHTSIEITRHTALTATGEYELAVYVDELAPHRRGTEAGVVTSVRSGGQVVWESRSTYLARHRTDGRQAAPPVKDVQKDGLKDGLKDVREERKPLPAVDGWRLASDVGRRYGAASGDRNPIHLHPLTARLFGFPRAIVHGMWTVARCLAAHGTPEAVLVRAEFKAPVLLPGTVTYAAQGGRFELRGGGTGVPPLARSRESERVHLAGEVYPLAS
ncbi:MULTISPECIES: MaoC/PaaZ C-terminal domain-containing protein [unclassified Streptomyces]|uniref:MaoC family dehydratase n=1 Tax=unclassified Streptomyces TaxID=2593676 RepID=UPI00236540A8|nr:MULTISPECIES: MaoC/PaaZ C-terminal domain-containing protein [unclassified Streptomyces]MDF3143855.1 MaoC/PaaZ C-terminal domain-containing protein [Streptomyces sp. T21Q-yed]WDF40419.1 MaoC/PaaZ C-terminal domain-containing protein [Streptomyces sp. T12]